MHASVMHPHVAGRYSRMAAQLAHCQRHTAGPRAPLSHTPVARRHSRMVAQLAQVLMATFSGKASRKKAKVSSW